MTASHDHRFPHGAKRIDLDDAVVALGKDKIVLSHKGANDHVTVHFGPVSGVLDVHKTSIAADGSAKHETMYKIAHSDLVALFTELGPVAMQALMKLTCRLDLDDLVRKRIGVIVGLLTTGVDLDAVTSVRRGRLIIDPEKLENHVHVPEDLNELYGIEDGKFFTLVSTQQVPHIVGHGFAITDATGHRQLVWLPSQRLAAEMDRLVPLLWAAVVKHGQVCRASDTLETILAEPRPEPSEPN